ncbi:MAG: LysM peptidoglycan-binding domain-containing protein [Candidatus Absconditicoccaceae bacterium]
MPRNYSKNRIKFFLTIFQISVFILIIVYADQFSRGNDTVYVNPTFVQMDDGNSDSISLDSIAIVELDNQDQGVIQYVVQAGDNLSKIASMFGTTISHIQKINNLGGRPIRPGDKIVVTDDEEGIIYDLPEKTNVLVFSNKYNLNVEDFMTMNNIQDETEILQQGQELFLPISQDRAYDIGLLTKPEPTPEPIKKYIPTIHKPGTIKGTKTIAKNPVNNTPTTPSATKAKISSKRVFNKKVSNGFAPGNCTWYVAAVMPQMFPYVDEDTQSRPFGGNAKDRYKNAKAAGYKVGQTPRAGSIIVYSQLRSSAGHVGIVDKYESESGELTIRDMNYAGKYIVTKRVDNSDNSKIIGYIYP